MQTVPPGRGARPRWCSFREPRFARSRRPCRRRSVYERHLLGDGSARWPPSAWACSADAARLQFARRQSARIFIHTCIRAYRPTDMHTCGSRCGALQRSTIPTGAWHGRDRTAHRLARASLALFAATGVSAVVLLAVYLHGQELQPMVAAHIRPTRAVCSACALARR